MLHDSIDLFFFFIPESLFLFPGSSSLYHTFLLQISLPLFYSFCYVSKKSPIHEIGDSRFYFNFPARTDTAANWAFVTFLYKSNLLFLSPTIRPFVATACTTG